MAVTTLDSSSNGRTGTLIGAPLPISVASPWTNHDRALQFDATQNYVNCGATGLGASGSFCLEAKVSPTVVSGGPSIAGKWGSSAGTTNFLLVISSGSAYIFVNDAFTYVSCGVITAAKHDVCGDYDGTTLRGFMDGALGGTAVVASLTAPDSVTPFIIGTDARLGSTVFPGIIDEVRLSNIARYTVTYTPATSPFANDGNTLGLWHLDNVIGEGNLATHAYGPN